MNKGYYFVITFCVDCIDKIAFVESSNLRCGAFFYTIIVVTVAVTTTGAAIVGSRAVLVEGEIDGGGAVPFCSGDGTNERELVGASEGSLDADMLIGFQGQG